MSMIWTEDMKETLRRLADEGFSYGEIAKRMNAAFGDLFTKNSLIGMARRIGVPRRPHVINKPSLPPSLPLITDLRDGMCKWPLGAMEDRPPYFYCGKPTGDIGMSWCPIHRKRVFNKSTYAASSPALERLALHPAR